MLEPPLTQVFRARVLRRALAVLTIQLDEFEPGSKAFAVGRGGLRATVCVGGAELLAEDDVGKDLLGRASPALLIARGRGRRQVECSASERAAAAKK
ncbi:MAG: hypothetical protein ACRENE_19025 [Polyangiaceae bacterium]